MLIFDWLILVGLLFLASFFFTVRSLDDLGMDQNYIVADFIERNTGITISRNKLSGVIVISRSFSRHYVVRS